MAGVMNRGRPVRAWFWREEGASVSRAAWYILARSCSFQNGSDTTRMRRMIIIALFQQLAVISSAFMQLHGLLYLFLLHRKRNIDLLVTHFAQKRNLIVKKCKELKLWRLRRKQRTRRVNDGRMDQWWQNVFSGVSPEEDWKKNFRMTRPQFEDLCEQLQLKYFQTRNLLIARLFRLRARWH